MKGTGREARALRMLGTMAAVYKVGSGEGKWSARRLVRGATGLVFGLSFAGAASAQICTTQARMTPAQRTEIGTAAYALATAVQAGDTAKVRANTIAQYAADFGGTEFLVHGTAAQVKGDTLQVTQAYLLDASGRKAGEAGDADFACPLAETAAETDFSIAGLPPGRYAFALVEAKGTEPWRLSFLLQAEGATWKMAGFYPHSRAAAGHDGLWYWTTARADARANRPWLAWLRYGEADQLLRPANFAVTSNLDKLRNEQRSAAPPALASGVSAQTPLAVKGADGANYAITSLESQTSDDARQLNLALHVAAVPGATADVATSRSVAVAQALLAAHPELASGGYSNVVVVADAEGGSPLVVERPMSTFAGAK